MSPIVKAEGLSRSFTVRHGVLGRARQAFAVRDVDIEVGRAEIVGVVGESGCGKSTLGRLLLRLLPPSEGRVLFDGQDLTRMPPRQLRLARRRMQMVFQDLVGSLDPRRRIGAQIADRLQAAPVSQGSYQDRVEMLLGQVGLDPTHAGRLPHEFSGGQRQRIAIARALSTGPDFIVADEPVAALDVSIQAQVVNLLTDIRERLGLAMLFISHDLHIVRHLADRVLVMYLGRVIEEGPAKEVFSAPAHPYTRALVAATPSMSSGARAQRPILTGDLPSPLDPPSGCAFRTRCQYAQARCAETRPLFHPVATRGRLVACLRADEIA